MHSWLLSFVFYFFLSIYLLYDLFAFLLHECNRSTNQSTHLNLKPIIKIYLAFCFAFEVSVCQPTNSRRKRRIFNRRCLININAKWNGMKRTRSMPYFEMWTEQQQKLSEKSKSINRFCTFVAIFSVRIRIEYISNIRQSG